MPRQLGLVHFFVLAALIATCGLAIAHTNEYLDTVEGEHGGQLRMSGAYHFELVARPGFLTIYVADHGFQAVDTAGATAEAMIVTDGKKTVLELTVSGANRLEGHGDFTLNEETTVHLKVVMPGGEAELASFHPLRKRNKKPDHSGHRDHH